MTTESYEPEGRRPRPIRNALLVFLFAFVLAVAIVTWAFTRWEPTRRLILPQPVATLSAPLTIAQPAPVSPTLPPAVPAADLPGDVAVTESRVAGLEMRLSQIDARAAAASANAARAEGLLIAFAVRRTIDRGAPLGYLEGQLRSRFAEVQPRAVAAVISAAQTPITLDGLRQRLDRIAPDLAGGGPEESWTAAIQRTVGGLFVVRRAEEPSPAPDQRLARARVALDGGQVDVALAEIARLPARAVANDWMAAARRYVEAQRALDILEASALTTGTPPTPAGSNVQ